jgi:hypothetical protein
VASSNTCFVTGAAVAVSVVDGVEDGITNPVGSDVCDGIATAVSEGNKIEEGVIDALGLGISEGITVAMLVISTVQPTQRIANSTVAMIQTGLFEKGPLAAYFAE